MLTFFSSSLSSASLSLFCSLRLKLAALTEIVLCKATPVFEGDRLRESRASSLGLSSLKKVGVEADMGVEDLFASEEGAVSM
jgi:hypothetical protein